MVDAVRPFDEDMLDAAPAVTRRELLALLASIAAFSPAVATAQADRRNVQASWNLKRLDTRSLDGLVLLRIFHGHFPLPAHLVLDTTAPPFYFVNYDREFGDDAQDGAVIAARRVDAARHPLMEWVRRAAPESRDLRYGLVIERRRHPPPAAGRPELRSVVISDRTHFVAIVGPPERLWREMIEAFGRMARSR
ncbi:MAG: hypothetical protein ACT4UP_03450 [Gammaproteobacteria bacterium]